MSNRRIFLSHSSKDKPFVRRLSTDLRMMGGISTWIDEVEIRVGDSLIEKISEGIESSNFLAIVLSENSVKSRWVTEELNLALTDQIGSGRIKILPLKIDECEVPAFLRSRLYADFTDPNNYRSSIRGLASALGVTLGEDLGWRLVDPDVRWYCQYCGSPCREPWNDYMCRACLAVQHALILTMTMITCPECHEYSPFVASFCGTCGRRLRA